MQVLLYNALNPAAIKGFSKWQKLVETDDLKSADIKKVGDNLYRARLNRSDRLLLAFYQYQGERYALVLEYLKNHDYASSRFLRGVSEIDEDKIPVLESIHEEVPALTYINPQQTQFNLLNKIISFDANQQTIFDLPTPIIIIGSAGSGKTALTLEKMKTATGDVLYVTQSPYLVKNARDLYYANHYTNETQRVDFLSFQEFLESIHVPQGKLVTFRIFADWFNKLPRIGIKDAHKIFEEIKGVLTAPAIDAPFLSHKDYLKLGIKQSIFLKEEREIVYGIFERYLRFLQENNLYDSNILSYHYLKQTLAKYDFVVVDEVQDLTNRQLYLILKALRNPEGFLLCGDANQIVHPNFFSWSKVKSLFYTNTELHEQEKANLIHILHTNYRNSPQVTELANRVLLLKNLRFGSIDRESNYLVKSNEHVHGNIVFLQDRDAIRHELNSKTRTSTRFAVVVMHEEQKAEAQQHFNTPLVFSIQEAKGLEYENIILYNFISAEGKRFREISAGVNADDLKQTLTYARTKDKADKSLEIYKFYINALYVALTRAICNLYWIETENKQNILELLGLTHALDSFSLENQGSSLEEWQREAHKLELQGKQEQAERIRREILQQKTPDWTVYTGTQFEQLHHQAIKLGDKKARLTLFEYALVYNDYYYLRDLRLVDFKPAYTPEKGIPALQQKHYISYQAKNPIALREQLNKFGVDFRNLFNQTPLMVAAWLGNKTLVTEMLARGANTELVDNQQFSTFHIALHQASQDLKYAKHALADIYPQLEPDSISLQVDGKLLKLDKTSMEFFLFNLMIALFYKVMPRKAIFMSGFETQDILNAVEHFPTSVLPERRKQRAYISSIFSKNEMYRQDNYNRKLFYRLQQGQYVFNPSLMVRIQGEWVNIYSLLPLEKLAFRPSVDTSKANQQDWDVRMQTAVNKLNARFQQVRQELLQEALSLLKVLCEQELRKIQDSTDS